ncbi:ATP-binding protein [Candidatus Microgenomates bacterium]|nr:ATP-binding protein [Candidatus Microgenomates bacterium]
MYQRHLDERLLNHVENRREITVLLGARQVGKTTILKRLFPKAQYFLVDNEPVQKSLERYDVAVYRQLLDPSVNVVVIDEIHRLSDPGRAAKIFFDQIPEKKLIITGSSSFSIKNKATESLAGRRIDYHLYPLTFTEYLSQLGIRRDLDFPILTKIPHGFKRDEDVARTFDLPAILEKVLLFGLYPVMVSQPADKLYLKNLAESVVFKDLLELSLVENRSAAIALLKLLAFQIGQLVNVAELADKAKLDVKTVQRYLSLFEQSFLIFFLPPFSFRGRDEISKMPKVYFYDLGLRNALIENFHPVAIRPDAGAMLENFIVSEAIKENYYGDFGYKLYFWRTKAGAEMDLVLTREKELVGWEVKSRYKSAGQAFGSRYPNAQVGVVTGENFL